MVVAEEHAQVAMAAVETPGAVEPLLVIPQPPLQALGKHLLVRCDPGEAALGDDLQGLAADRPLGRPHAVGNEAEHGPEIVDAAANLGPGVFGVAEVRSGNRDARQGVQGDAGIAQKRQNRMVVGGDRQFDGPRIVEPLVERDDCPDHLPLGIEEQFLVGGGVGLPLGNKLAKGRVTAAGRLAGPGQEEADLQVQQVLIAEMPHPIAGIARFALSGHVEQLQVAPVRLDHALAVGGEEVLQQEDAVVFAEVRRSGPAHLQEAVHGRAVGIVQNLLDQ